MVNRPTMFNGLLVQGSLIVHQLAHLILAELANESPSVEGDRTWADSVTNQFNLIPDLLWIYLHGPINDRPTLVDGCVRALLKLWNKKIMMNKSLPSMSVTVVDALMGAGKTTAAIDLMKTIHGQSMFPPDDSPSSAGRRFVYITPFLDEVERIRLALNGDADKGDARIVYEPVIEGGKKLNGLNSLLAQGANVVSTHALFQHIDEETVQALQEYDYTLIIDEVTEWVSQLDISKADLKMLFNGGLIKVDVDTRRVEWIDPPGEKYAGKFTVLRSLCRLRKVVCSRTSKRDPGLPSLLLWQLPIEMLNEFDSVIVLTHLFEGSDMSAYFNLHGVGVEKKTVGRDGAVIPYDRDLEQSRVDDLRSLIHIEDDEKLNSIGSPKSRRSCPLSSTWFATDKKMNDGREANKLQNAVYAFFQRKAGVRSGATLWATYKARKAALSGKGYARGFLPLNARATNEYRGRTALAYLVNLYRHPFISGYFTDAGVATSEDAYALSVMSQWIFRSAVRDGKPIRVYIPSQRMRLLLEGWLAGTLTNAQQHSAEEATTEA